MTNFNVLALIGAIVVANSSLWFFVDSLISKRIDAIATGVVRGTMVSVQHRRLMLYFSWGMLVTAGLSACVIGVFFFIYMGRNIADPGLRGFAYFIAFFHAGGFLGWFVPSFFWYFHLTRVLRQAEAD